MLDAQEKLGGEDLDPFFDLMTGGRDGEFFREMEDYFYYAQIRRYAINYLLFFHRLYVVACILLVILWQILCKCGICKGSVRIGKRCWMF